MEQFTFVRHSSLYRDYAENDYKEGKKRSMSEEEFIEYLALGSCLDKKQG